MIFLEFFFLMITDNMDHFFKNEILFSKIIIHIGENH